MPHNSTRWYLLHAPGREQATCDKLLKLLPRDLLEDAFVMKKERVRKRDGQWVTYPTQMYKDYLFAVTRDVGALDRELGRLSLPVRIAKGEGNVYTPMAEEARGWYERMMDPTRTIRTSTAVIVDGELQVQKGPLVGQESRVVKVMRQRCACLVSVSDGGSGFTECVPLCVPYRS